MKFLALIGLAAGLVACTGLSTQPDPTEVRLDQLEQQNRALTEQLQKQQRLLAGFQAADIGGQTQSMEAQLRDIRGQVEQLGFQLRTNEERQRKLAIDFDRRLMSLEGGTGQAAGGGKGPAPLRGAEEQAYVAAFNMLKGGQFVDSIKAFRSFLSDFPGSAYGGNAQYWIGEAYYVQQDFAAALVAFDRVISDFATSNKVGDALLKKGYVLIELKQAGEARKALDQVISQFPDTTAAKLARERLDKLKAGGDA